MPSKPIGEAGLKIRREEARTEWALAWSIIHHMPCANSFLLCSVPRSPIRGGRIIRSFTCNASPSQFSHAVSDHFHTFPNPCHLHALFAQLMSDTTSPLLLHSLSTLPLCACEPSSSAALMSMTSVTTTANYSQSLDTITQ